MDRLLGKEISINGNSRWVKLCDSVLSETEGAHITPLCVTVYRLVDSRLWRIIDNSFLNNIEIKDVLKNKESI